MKRLSRLLAAALTILLLAPLPSRAAVSPGVGIVTDSLFMAYDAANPNSYFSSTSTTNFNDLSGNGYTATLANTPTYTHGVSGSYFSFAGGNSAGAVQSVNVPSIPTSLSFSAGFSFSFYGTFGNTADAYERIFDFGVGQQNYNILFGRDYINGDVFYETYNGTSTLGRCTGPSTGTGSITTGLQQYTLVVSATGGCQFYLNGSAITSTKENANDYRPLSGAGITRASNFLAKSNWSADASLEGKIYRIAFYNKALSTAEVTQNYNSMTDTSWPTISTATFSTPENKAAVDTLTASESAIFSIISGNDSSKFSMTSSGVISFITPPNFEVPTDSNVDNVYLLNIQILDSNGNYNSGTLSITVTNVAEFASLGAASLSGIPYKGIPVTITVTPSAGNTAGKITFLMAGKRIVGCYRKSYSGTGGATCTWKPTTMGFREISITFTPNGVEYAPATLKSSYLITNRTTNR